MLNGIVTSDWHLGGMSKIFTDPTEKQLVEIHKPYQHAIENGIENVFVPGDMSDSPKMDDRELIALVTMLLQYDSHVHTYYLLGNHDVASIKKTSMDVLRIMAENGMFKRFHLFFKPTVQRIEGVDVCFMPFPHTKVLKSKKTPLVFAHVETAGAVGDNGRILKGKEDSLTRQEGDFVFSGHLHQSQILKKQRIAYGGSLYQKNFGEALPKGFLEFTAKYVNGRLKVDHEFINSRPNFTLVNKLIEKSEDWETLSKDESIRYKILVGEGVIVPKNITTEFPNIIYINGVSSKTKVNMDGSMNNTGGVTLKDLPTFSITTGLPRYLKDADLNKKQIEIARSLVREAREALGL